MPQAVINAINSRAKAEKMPSLKIQSKHLRPEAWLAEVDGAQDEPEDDGHDENSVFPNKVGVTTPDF